MKELKTLPVLIVVLVLVIGGSLANAENEEKSQMKPSNAGKDIHAFTWSAEMLQTKPATPFDAKAAALVLEINADTGSIDSPEALSRVINLNPYRNTAEVRSAVATLVDRLAKQVTSLHLSGSQNQLLESGVRQANLEYRKKHLEAASSAYVALLAEAPGQWDIRNNLALTQIHLGNDLAAQVELEVLRKVEPKYLPALINLTVVYMRLGRDADAQATALEAARLQPDFSSAIYNLAWFKNLNGDLKGARKDLEPLSAQDSQRYNGLYDLTVRQIGLFRRFVDGLVEFVNGGLVGSAGCQPNGGAVFLFILPSLAIIGVCARRHHYKAMPGVFAFVKAGIIFYLVFWGVGFTLFRDGWLPMLIYAAVGSGITAICTRAS